MQLKDEETGHPYYYNQVRRWHSLMYRRSFLPVLVTPCNAPAWRWLTTGLRHRYVVFSSKTKLCGTLASIIFSRSTTKLHVFVFFSDRFLLVQECTQIEVLSTKPQVWSVSSRNITDVPRSPCPSSVYRHLEIAAGNTRGMDFTKIYTGRKRRANS